MKKIFTLLAASVASLGLNAQITITQSDYAGWTPRIDTFRDITSGANVTLGAGASWDFTGATYDPNDYGFGYFAFTNAGLPTATYAYLGGYGFSTLNYVSNIAGAITATGVLEVGESVSAQSLDISALTHKAGDSLIFPAQVLPYSASRVLLQFPVTSGKTWTSAFNAKTNVTLKYGGNYYGFSRTKYASQLDSVNGWGRVRVKRMDGSNSTWIDVLAVKSRLITEDSFSSATIPQGTLNMIIGPFGLTQGMRDSFFSVSLYRKGEVDPLVMVGYTDKTYSKPDYTSVHQSRIPASVGVNEISNAAGITLFPNPATAASGFNIDIVEIAAGTWSYSLLDASGKVISSAVISPNGTKAHIDAAQAAPGTYFLNVQNNGQSVATKPLVIAK